MKIRRCSGVISEEEEYSAEIQNFEKPEFHSLMSGIKNRNCQTASARFWAHAANIFRFAYSINMDWDASLQNALGRIGYVRFSFLCAEIKMEKHSANFRPCGLKWLPKGDYTTKKCILVHKRSIQYNNDRKKKGM